MFPDRFPADKPAYIMAGSGEVVTYGELTERSRRGARFMREQGAEHGDTVAFLLENHPRLLELAWAAQRAGLRYTAISPRLTRDEVAYILEDSGAKLLFHSAQTFEVAHAAAKVPLVDLDALRSRRASQLDDEVEGVEFLYSSGTTGRPKAIKSELPFAPIGTPPAILGALRAALRLRRGHGVPLPRAAVPLGAAALQHGRPAARRHLHRDGALRSARGAAPRRASSRDPHADGPDDVRAPAAAAARPLRPRQPALRGPRRGALPGRDQGADDRVARPDRARVLLLDRGPPVHGDLRRGMADAQGLGRPRAAGQAAHPRRRVQRAAGG